MPGVNRPMTLTDVLQTIYDQGNSATQAITGTIATLSVIAEVDETMTSSDSSATFVTTPLGWDQEGWGAIAWG